MKSFLFFCYLLFCQIVFSQVNFAPVSFTDALRKSQEEGKIIFLQFEAADCNQCNDVANKGLGDKEVADKINQIFICVKITVEHPDRIRVAKTYSVNAEHGFGTLFINPDGTVIHKFLRTTSLSKDYLAQVDIALQKAGEALKINELENEYKKGNKSFGFLEVLLQKRKALNFPTDSLLEVYINALPPDSLSSTNTLAFIAQMMPFIESKADKVMRKNVALFNKAWYSMNLQRRQGINNAIIYKSMTKAITEKNESYAAHVASFAQGTNSNYSNGTKAYDINMLRFYNETNDTATYFRKAIAYYERYFLVLSVDSIKKADSMNLKKMLVSGSIKGDTLREGNTIKTIVRVAYASIAQSFSRELDNGAEEFYKKTNNPYLLSIATEWAVRATAFYKSPQTLSTLAKLLYKQKQNTQAMEVINEAVVLQQQRGYPTSEYDSILAKMKNNMPLE